MVQENGSRFKLVFSHFIDQDNQRYPIPNGLHPCVSGVIQNLIKDGNKVHLHYPYHRFDDFHQQVKDHVGTEGFLFNHANFYGWFRIHHGHESSITVDEIKDDNSVYLYLVEVTGSWEAICGKHTFTINGESVNFTFKDTIPPKILDHLRSGKVKLVVNNNHDPIQHPNTLRLIETDLETVGIDGSNIIFVSGSKYSKEEYAQCYPTSKIKTINSELALLQYAMELDAYPFTRDLGYVSDRMREEDLDKQRVRSKKFLCFNRSINRPHRFSMAYLALKHDLLKDGYFSFLNNNPQHEISYYLGELLDYDDLIEMSKKIDALIPLQLDTFHLTPEGRECFFSSNAKKDFFIDSYIHIISETVFDKWEDPYLSEKTFRPLTNMQPFIYVGGANSIKKLKDLGFKTFHPFIDESYDSETDPKKRFAMIEKEIKKFAEMPIEQIHEWYYSITDILIHNQTHLRTFNNFNPVEHALQFIVNEYGYSR